MTPPNSAVVLGARNLGAEITRGLLRHGAAVASIARTPADLDLLAEDGALPLRADAGDRGQLDEALEHAARVNGPPDLIVNAVAPGRSPDDGSGFGGGAMLAATQAGFDAWVLAVARQAFVLLGAAAEVLAERGGTVVQITGAPARRASAERGLISAGGAAVRAMTHAMSQELAGHGVHVALLVVDGPIASPKTAAMTRAMPAAAIVEQAGVAAAVHALACQPPDAWTHELVVTPSGGRWVP